MVASLEEKRLRASWHSALVEQLEHGSNLCRPLPGDAHAPDVTAVPRQQPVEAWPQAKVRPTALRAGEEGGHLRAKPVRGARPPALKGAREREASAFLATDKENLDRGGGEVRDHENGKGGRGVGIIGIELDGHRAPLNRCLRTSLGGGVPLKIQQNVEPAVRTARRPSPQPHRYSLPDTRRRRSARRPFCCA